MEPRVACTVALHAFFSKRDRYRLYGAWWLWECDVAMLDKNGTIPLDARHEAFQPSIHLLKTVTAPLTLPFPAPPSSTLTHAQSCSQRASLHNIPGIIHNSEEREEEEIGILARLLWQDKPQKKE